MMVDFVVHYAKLIANYPDDIAAIVISTHSEDTDI